MLTGTAASRGEEADQISTSRAKPSIILEGIFRRPLCSGFAHYSSACYDPVPRSYADHTNSFRKLVRDHIWGHITHLRCCFAAQKASETTASRTFLVSNFS
jgi:hypothetical protein